MGQSTDRLHSLLLVEMLPMIDFQLLIPKDIAPLVHQFLMTKGWWFRGPQPLRENMGFIITGRDHFEAVRHYLADVQAKLITPPDEPAPSAETLLAAQEYYLTTQRIPRGQFDSGLGGM